MIYIVQRVGNIKYDRGGIWFTTISPENIFKLKKYEAMHYKEGYKIAQLDIHTPFYFFVGSNELDYPIDLYATLTNWDSELIGEEIRHRCKQFAITDDWKHNFNECIERELSEMEQTTAKLLRSKGYDAVLFINDENGIPEQIFYIGDKRKIKWLN